MIFWEFTWNIEGFIKFLDQIRFPSQVIVTKHEIETVDFIEIEEQQNRYKNDFICPNLHLEEEIYQQTWELKQSDYEEYDELCELSWQNTVMPLDELISNELLDCWVI